MEEFLSLRRRQALEVIPPEDLLRLSNLYLIQGLYAKSADLYAELIQQVEQSTLPQEKRVSILAQSHYNRGLALFTLKFYDSGRVNFERALYYNPSNIEALRMIGTTAYLQQQKDDADTNWSAYLENAPEGPTKDSVQAALDRLRSPDFSFESSKKEEPQRDELWPFRNFEAIPYPDALYEKKRVI